MAAMPWEASPEFGLCNTPFWDWDTPRTVEGYYRYQGGTQCAMNRTVTFMLHMDLLWIETKQLILSQACEFARHESLHRNYPVEGVQAWHAHALMQQKGYGI